MYKEIVVKDLRSNKLPHIWCAGCGNGIVLSCLVRAIEKTGWDHDRIVIVSGIGCAGRVSGYMNFDTLHTLHGRAIAFATGIKLANPDLHVIVATGDGDAVSIGGNHLIHAARRNVGLKVIVFNNDVYGMTGGQASPTTPRGAKTTTTPYNNDEYAFDIIKLALSSGASYAARETVANPVLLEKYIYNALVHKGFSIVDAVTICVTEFGRRNKLSDPVQFIKEVKERSIPRSRVADMKVEELDGKFVVGEFVNYEKQEFTERYFGTVKRLKNEG